MSRPALARISADALRANFNQVRRHAPGRRVMAVVKANAYGHGLIQAATTLADADALGVSCLEEAETLRAAGIRQPIVLLEGFFDAEELARIAVLDLDIVVHSEHQLSALEQSTCTAALVVWLKLDTGMHRLGFEPTRAAELRSRLLALPQVREVRFMSHLSSADEIDNSTTPAQLQCFNDATRGLAGSRSLANSAAVLAWPESHFDWVRPGIMLYGISPFADRNGRELGLVPVMQLETRLISVRACKAGDAVGYGGAGVCPRDMPVGVAAIGYGDGYPRHAGTGTPALVNGVRCQLLGRVSMDMIALDLSARPDARVGDTVELWGNGLAVEEVARHAGTIAYELVCAVSARVRVEHIPAQRSPTDTQAECGHG